MHFITFAVASVLAAAVAAHSNVTYVTEVLTEYTTFCPEPTTLTFNDVTYTITEVKRAKGGRSAGLRRRIRTRSR